MENTLDNGTSLIDKYLNREFELNEFIRDLGTVFRHTPYIKCRSRTLRYGIVRQYISYLEFCYDRNSNLRECDPNHNLWTCPDQVWLASYQHLFPPRFRPANPKEDAGWVHVGGGPWWDIPPERDLPPERELQDLHLREPEEEEQEEELE